MDKKIREEIKETNGNGEAIIYICWEDSDNPEVRGFYEKSTK